MAHVGFLGASSSRGAERGPAAAALHPPCLLKGSLQFGALSRICGLSASLGLKILRIVGVEAYKV